jgi:hypothetical protein
LFVQRSAGDQQHRLRAGVRHAQREANARGAELEDRRIAGLVQ